jgi:hypothetical protein
LTNTICFDVDTPDGAGVLEKVYLTELGLVMGKVFFPSKGVWVNYQLTNLENLLEFKSNIKKTINGSFKNVKVKRRRKKIENVLQS